MLALSGFTETKLACANYLKVKCTVLPFCYPLLAQRLFCGAILVDVVTLVVCDGRVNISHFHLEQNKVFPQGAAGSKLPAWIFIRGRKQMHL